MFCLHLSPPYSIKCKTEHCFVGGVFIISCKRIVMLELYIDLSVGITVYNSVDIVPELCRWLSLAINEQFGGGNYKFIFVNDCSSGSAWTALADASALYANCRAINLRKNAGQHGALLAGMRGATGSIVVLMDNDLQHAP